MVVDKEKNKDVVYVGSKEFMKYVNAVEWQLREFNKVTIRARGKFTSRAIDISQIILSRHKLKLTDIKITSEEFVNKEDKKVRVSAIDLVLEKV